ncbi:MAG: hypothetical protein PHQ96_03750 [Candidatus Omnitrophica bacterium]|nr:hypothetical protein [Candidatus Omnitrophota bacterium]
MIMRKKIIFIILISLLNIFIFTGRSYAATPISYGQILPGSISAANEKDEFTFSGTSGTVIAVLAAKTQGDLVPYLELYNPSGTKVQENYITILGYPLQANGTFKIVLRDYQNTNTGNYEICLYKINSPAGATSLNFDQTVSAQLTSPVKVDAYKFTTAAAGEKVFLSLSIPSASSPNFYPNAFLCDAQGVLVAQSDYAGVLSKTLSTSGTFYLFIGNGALSGTGSYQFTLSRWQAPAVFTDINFGQTSSGSLSSPTEIKTFRFSASAGDKVYISTGMLFLNQGDFQPVVELFDAAGNLLTPTDYYPMLYSFSNSGNFYIMVRDNYHNGVGLFEFTLQRTNNPANLKSLNYGQLIEDPIEVVTGINAYGLNATIGDNITLCSGIKAETQGDFGCNFELFNTSGGRQVDAYGSLKYTFAASG